MNNEDFPGIFQAADQLSKRAQGRFFRALFSNLVLLVCASFLSILNYHHWGLAWLQVIVLLGALGLSIYLAATKPERMWYSARAVAESVKTLAWRYVSKAEPFFEGDARALFYNKLRMVIMQNKHVADKLISHLEDPNITQSMMDLRAKSLEERKAAYIDFRISDQLIWYSKKAKINQNRSHVYFGLLIFVNMIAIALSAARIKFVGSPYFSADVFIAIAASLLSWMQAKRFSELSASYALAAHEINIIKGQTYELLDDQRFSIFVGDTENAFSREHTQWIARKDN